MSSQHTRDDLGRLETAQLPVLRDKHLEEPEFIAFSQGHLEQDERQAVLKHLDVCPRCREVLAELHRDDDGHGSTKLSDPLLGRMLGEYKVQEALSRGGMGVVYRGEHPLIGKKVAIKVLLPDAAEDPDQMNRLLGEARAVNAIRHPNIIDIFSFGELPDGKHYFIMELLDGLPLNELLVEKGKLTPGEVLTVLEQSMAALGAAHGAGVIHRDLKPANLFLTTLPDHSWHITVLDFGLAKRLGASSSTSPNLVMGTPGYMAPEQIRGQEVTPRTDLYAMGVVAWVLLTGTEPFTADSFVDLMMKHLEDHLPNLQKLAPDCPRGLVSLIERLLAKQQTARPQSALEVQAELHRLRKDLAGHQTMKTPGPVIPLEQLQKPELRQGASTLPLGAVKRLGPAPAAPMADPGEPAPTRIVPRRAQVVTKPSAEVRRAPRPEQESNSAPAPVPKTDRTPLYVLGVVALLGLVGLGAWKVSRPHEVTPEQPPVELTRVDPPPVEVTKVEVEQPKPPPIEVEQPKPPPVEVAQPKPPVVKQPAGPSTASVERRLAQGRQQAAKLPSAAARRMMNLDLDALEKRLKSGEALRAVSRDLEDVISNYAAP